MSQYRVTILRHQYVKAIIEAATESEAVELAAIDADRDWETTLIDPIEVEELVEEPAS